jgi:ribosome maturation factor RimP
MTETTNQKIERFIDDLLEPTRFELVWVEFTKAGQQWILRIFIDCEGGVGLGECQEVTEMVLDAVEQNDPLNREYQIEVSSPGVDRPLRKARDYQRFIGHRVFVKSHRAQEGRKTFTGTLHAFEDGRLSLLNEEDERTYQVSLEDVAKATLKPILKFS